MKKKTIYFNCHFKEWRRNYNRERENVQSLEHELVLCGVRVFFQGNYIITSCVGGAVASWLVRSTPARAVRVRALAGDIVLWSWARHFTLTVPLSTQVYKWVPANCWGNLTNYGEVTSDGLASRPGEVEILIAASCYRNRNKHRQLWASLGSKASLTLLTLFLAPTTQVKGKRYG